MVCYLQTLEPRKHVQVQRSKNQGKQWCKSGLESKGPRTRCADVQGQETVDVPAQAKAATLLLLCLFVLLRPPVDWMVPSYIGESSVLYSVYK